MVPDLSDPSSGNNPPIHCFDDSNTSAVQLRSSHRTIWRESERNEDFFLHRDLMRNHQSNDDTKPLITWLTFESHLARWARDLVGDRLVCRAGYQAIPGFPSNGFRADALITDGRILVAVEVEVRQTHPDTNVGKYWLLAEHHQYEKVILIHVYTPPYNSYPWRKTLGEFYARKMEAELPFEYVQLDLRAETEVDAAFLRVTQAVEARVNAEFA